MRSDTTGAEVPQRLTISDLAQLGTIEVRLCSGDALFGVHDRPDALFVVADGCIRLLSTTSDGRTLTLALLDPGDTFGEVSLVPGRVSGVAAEACADSVVHRIPLRNLQRNLEDHPRLAVSLLASVTRRLHDAEELSRQLAHWNVQQRLGHVLGVLADRYGHPTLSGDLIINRVFTHRDLADMIGATRQTVSEGLAHLTRMHVLSRRRRRFVIHDRPAIERFGRRDEPVPADAPLNSWHTPRWVGTHTPGSGPRAHGRFDRQEAST